jgi:hypothetical protein
MCDRRRILIADNADLWNDLVGGGSGESPVHTTRHAQLVGVPNSTFVSKRKLYLARSRVGVLAAEISATFDRNCIYT